MSEQDSTVQVRPFRKEDLKRMVIWNQDPEVEQFVDRGLPQDLAGCERWFEEVKQHKEYQLYAIEDENGNLIGDLELDHICWRRRDAELRVRIGEKEYWNRGYGTLALQQMIGYVFHELGLDLLYLRVYAFNHRAIHCYKKLGFRKRAKLKRETDPHWKEIYLMVLNKSEFKKPA